MESLTPFIRHELEDAPGPSGPPEETSSVVSPPLGAGPGQPPVTEPPKPVRGSQQPPSQPDGPDVQLPPPEVPQPRPDCSIQHPGQVVLHTTSQSASQTAPLVGEPLAYPASFTRLPKPPLVRSNGDDRRQRRKQGGAVGAAASRMQATAKQTLGAATRAVALRSNDGEVSIPMTDGTPTACRQKNAAEYLAGRSPGVMAQYGGGLFGAEQHLHSREPAPDEDQSGVLQLVEWREEAPYG